MQYQILEIRVDHFIHCRTCLYPARNNLEQFVQIKGRDVCTNQFHIVVQRGNTTYQEQIEIKTKIKRKDHSKYISISGSIGSLVYFALVIVATIYLHGCSCCCKSERFQGLKIHVIISKQLEEIQKERSNLYFGLFGESQLEIANSHQIENQ